MVQGCRACEDTLGDTSQTDTNRNAVVASNPHVARPNPLRDRPQNKEGAR